MTDKPEDITDEWLLDTAKQSVILAAQFEDGERLIEFLRAFANRVLLTFGE